ncbi:MAG: GTPase HflX, partial [Actinomycetota bacterium]
QAGGRAAGGVGIGGRGPGETQLEVDRRRIMRRIAKLRRDLSGYRRIRDTKASERERNHVQVAALVGYTNAGKSSLLNALTGADVRIEDKLFATLDPTVRQLPLEDGRHIVLTDTVGFINKLPHGLVEAFTSTLEESTRAELLLHVVDAAHPEAESQILAVHEVLEEIGADQQPEQLVLNKIDRVDRASLDALARRVRAEFGADPVLVSAHTGQGLEQLIERIGQRLPNTRYRVSGHVPYARQDLVALAHRHGTVVEEGHDATGTALVADVDQDAAMQLRDYLDDDPFEAEPEPWERELG